MKSLILGVLLICVLFPIDYKDIPSYTVEQIHAIAKNFSPECKQESCG